MVDLEEVRGQLALLAAQPKPQHVEYGLLHVGGDHAGSLPRRRMGCGQHSHSITVSGTPSATSQKAR